MGRGSAPPMAGNGPAVRGSSVQGFPFRYYDWRVLDEHFERGFRQRVTQFSQRGRPPKRNGRDQKTPDGRSSDRILFYKDALRRPPVFPACKQWPGAKAGVARGKHTRFFDMMGARSSVQSISAQYGGYGLVLPVCHQAQAVETRRSPRRRGGLPEHRWQSGTSRRKWHVRTKAPNCL